MTTMSNAEQMPEGANYRVSASTGGLQLLLRMLATQIERDDQYPPPGEGVRWQRGYAAATASAAARLRLVADRAVVEPWACPPPGIDLGRTTTRRPARHTFPVRRLAIVRGTYLITMDTYPDGFQCASLRLCGSVIGEWRNQ